MNETETANVTDSLDPNSAEEMRRLKMDPRVRLLMQMEYVRGRQDGPLDEPVPAKTRGQEIAAELIGPLADEPMRGVALYPDGAALAPLTLSPLGFGNEMTIASARQMVARVIDKAIAEEREACAAAVTEPLKRFDEQFWSVSAEIAGVIRNRK